MSSFFNRKNFIILFAVLFFIGGILYYLAEHARSHAGDIFNHQMEKQTSLAGKVTVEKLWADLAGNVYFDKFVWADENGRSIVEADKGRMKVKLSDVIFRNISIDSLLELELEQPFICIGFDENMHINVLGHKGNENKEDVHKHNNKDESNFRLKKKLPNIHLILKNGTISAEYKERNFILKDVNLNAEVKHHNKIKLKIDTGSFGGTMVGNGMQMNGFVNLNAKKPTAELNLSLHEVVPKSLGLGNIDKPMSIFGEVTGNIDNPFIKGAVSMKELDLPPLVFRKIEGIFVYNNGQILLEDVTGNIFGGNLEAMGFYNIDKRNYHINAQGRNLIAAAALKSNKIKGKIDLNLRMICDGPGQPVRAYGAFSSEGGYYSLIPFKRLSGSFSNVKRELDFSNVELDTAFGSFKTESLKIHNGKVILSTIYLVEDNGEKKIIRE